MSNKYGSFIHNLIMEYNIIPISLGSNCFFKDYFQRFKQETYFFDWIGTSLWFINNFFFEDIDMFDINDIKLIKPLLTYVYTNIKYNIRFLHDINKLNESVIEQTKNKYTRRKHRFIELLNTTHRPIVFFRLEENLKNRNILDDHKKYYDKSEFEYSLLLIEIIKRKFPNLKFKLILISYDHENYQDANLLVLKINNDNIRWLEHKRVFDNIFLKNEEVVRTFLRH